MFGGWQASGLAPLARLQVFDVEQRRWSSHSSGGSGGSSSSTSGTTASTAGSTSAALAFSKVEPANGGAADQLGITDGFKAISMNGHTSAAPGAEAGPELAQTAGHAAPCARGQPTLTATTDGGAMLLFGGCASAAESHTGGSDCCRFSPSGWYTVHMIELCAWPARAWPRTHCLRVSCQVGWQPAIQRPLAPGHQHMAVDSAAAVRCLTDCRRCQCRR